MKKHHFIKMSSIALSLCVALGTFPATAFADDANATTITKAYVDKATYAPGEAATIYVDVDGATGTKTAHIQITHLNETVWENDVTFTANGGKTTVPISWTPPTTDHQGYLVSITIDGKQIVTAIDVSSDVTTYPRYGYSVDFMPGETSAESDAMMKELAQVYHVNIVQYYDWMYRHEKILPDEGDEWVDMFGHTLSRQTIQQRIDAGHAYNQKAMAYQMSYMAREGYTENGVDPKWGLYSSQTNHNIDYNPSDNSTISGIDQYLFPLEGKPAPLLMTFNPLNTDWQNFMANQYKGAINTLDFDGIQIDQMGDFWGRDAQYYDYDGNYVNLGESFAPFTNAIKRQLTENNSAKNIVTMNAVNGGSEDYFSSNSIISTANTDFAFSELWGNSDSYKKVNDFINWQKMQDGGKAIVLAAYMNQYDINGTTYSYRNAQLTGVHTNSENGVTYITGFDEVGDRAEITIEAPEDGNYSLVFLAANGTDTQASKSIYLDGTKYMTAYFDATRNGVIPAEPDWYYYSYDASFTAPKNLYLTKGTHTLTIQQDADDKGGDIRLQTVTLGVYDENSVRLTNAAIAASGAMHIEMGSGMSTTANSGENFNDVSLLGNPYYPKAAKSMTSSLEQAMYNQYQFITAYENLLYDANVLPSDTGLQNISISNETISGDAKPGTIWYVIKNKGNDYGLIHLINLTGENDEDWRNVTGTPNAKQNLTVKYYIPQYKDISGVYCASPDTGCISNALAYNVQTDDVGKYVEIQVPSLEYWDMIYIRYNDNTLTDTVEAENSILTNVSTNNNHGGYSGTGFVDSYGKAGDAVTMDFFVPETGDYKLSFVYSAAVDGTPKRDLYINAYGYDSISFPATSNWEEWNTSETTVHLRAGIQRMVVYCNNADDGYINFDCVHISKSA